MAFRLVVAASLLALLGCEPLLAPGLIAVPAGSARVHVSSDPDVGDYHLEVSGVPSSVVAGTLLMLKVTVVDAQGHLVNYRGILSFRSSDRQSALPGDLTISGGQVTAGVTLKTAAAQTLTVADAAASALASANASIQVLPGEPRSLGLSGFPAQAQAGQAAPLSVEAQDAYGNAVDGNFVVRFTSTDAQAQVPADLTLVHGAATSAPGALFTAGTQTWSASVANNADIASQRNVTVSAGPVSLAASSLTANPTAVHNDNSSSTVLACALRDGYGNPIADTQVAFSSSQVQFTPSSARTNAAGQASSQARSGSQGYKTVTATFGGQSLTTKVGIYDNCNGVTTSATNQANGTSMARSQGVAIGDINGDGSNDLVVANYETNNVTVLTNKGSGAFSLGNVNTVAAGNGANAVLLVDLDLDGKLDLLTADWRGNTLSVFRGAGDGTFGARVAYNTGANPVALTTADLNGDGRPDVAVANQRDNTVSLFLGAGPVLKPLPAADQNLTSTGIAAADMDGDGDMDLVTSSFTSNAVTVLLNRGDGRAYTAAAYSDPNAYWVALADFNNDGKPDVVTPNFGSSAQPGNTVSVLLNAGNGSLLGATPYAVNARPVAVGVGDFNVDGRPDIAVTNNNTLTASLLLGKGDGTFEQHVDITLAAPSPYAIAVGDFSGDGRPDVAVSHDNTTTLGDGTNGSVSIIVNGCH